MVFFHSCNRSGLFSQAALNTISRFSMVTIEKGQGFDTGQAGCAALQERPPCAEAMIKEQLRRVKMHNTRVTTVFYMNLVLDWYFYDMHTMLESKPAWQLLDSRSGKPMRVSGDKVFDPPPEGLLVFNHAVGEMREHWKKICIKSGADGCFADSSQEGSHLTSYYLNNEDGAAFEEGKVQTMRELTVQFSGRPGKPYNQYFPKGVLLGKHAGQRGINAFQIENFEANEQSIAELVEGVQRGYLVQVHGRRGTHIEFEHGCRGQDKEKYTDVVAAFLIGAGKDCFFGTGPWISPSLQDVQDRWCSDLFDRPLGEPDGPAVRIGDRYTRRFSSGTTVHFDVSTNRGNIFWANLHHAVIATPPLPSPRPPPLPSSPPMPPPPPPMPPPPPPRRNSLPPPDPLSISPWPPQLDSHALLNQPLPPALRGQQPRQQNALRAPALLIATRPPWPPTAGVYMTIDSSSDGTEAAVENVLYMGAINTFAIIGLLLLLVAVPAMAARLLRKHVKFSEASGAPFKRSAVRGQSIPLPPTADIEPASARTVKQELAPSDEEWELDVSFTDEQSRQVLSTPQWLDIEEEKPGAKDGDAPQQPMASELD